MHEKTSLPLWFDPEPKQDLASPPRYQPKSDTNIASVSVGSLSHANETQSGLLSNLSFK